MDTDNTTRTGQWVYAGTWIGAGIVMATTAANAVATFGALGGNRLVGLGVGIAVDVALCVGLIGDRQLALHQITSPWGRALRITAGIMSLTIAVIAAVVQRHYELVALLAFLPVLLIVLTEYGQDVYLAFGRLTKTPSPVPTQEPVPAAVWEPHPVVSTNGHRDRGDGGWFPVPTWVPSPPPVPVSDPVPTRPQARSTPPKPVPTSPVTGDVPGLDTVREWRTQRTNKGLPVGREALRSAFPGLTERDARTLISQLKTVQA